ncbi:hypothetical protein [Geobacillus kaustophilus]|uniref:hypothetical protein n=1 Tax=Geobacillus kaustophilus TaxID=1462 RepID=UPI0005CD6FD7|nr:hypothetical protein [Geobacillus kaustophilus]
MFSVLFEVFGYMGEAMFSEKIYKEVDSSIKKIWLEDIKKDYLQYSLQKKRLSSHGFNRGMKDGVAR